MPKPKIAYILSRFPALTETFITREILELKRLGVELEIYSLKQPDKNLDSQAQYRELIKNTHYFPFFFSWSFLGSTFYYLRIKPKTIFRILYKVMKSNLNRPVDLFKTLAVIPKVLIMARVMHSNKIAGIHAHWATLPTTVAWAISQLNDCEYTFTAHAWDIYLADNMLGDKIRTARKVITCTRYNKEYLTRNYPNINSDKIEVIYHGLNLSGLNLKHNTNNSVFRILSVGRLVQQKGFHILLRACQKLIQRNIKFRCDIVYVKGDIDKEIFKLHRELELENHVKLIPAMPHEELLKLYYESDSFVLPCVISDNGERDGIPNVIIEALAVGLPVVSTDVSGVPEVVTDGESGLMAIPKDADDLAEKIQTLYEDPELRARLGKSGRKIVKEQFDLTKNTKKIMQIIEDR